MAELLEGRHPFQSLVETCNVEWEYSIKLRNQDIQLPEFTSELKHLIKDCISWNPEDRPSFIEIVQQLNVH